MKTKVEEFAGSLVKESYPEYGRMQRHSEQRCGSPLEFLADLRDVVIPEMLREASGLSGETDLEVLLDGSGYSVSLVAEELIFMIDECIESKNFDSGSLDRIKQAYNGLSGFNASSVGRTTGWDGMPMRVMNTPETHFRTALAV